MPCTYAPSRVVFRTLALGVLGLSSLAFAETPPGIQLGLPIYGGTGCPVGSASANLSPDAQTLSILFDEFNLEAGFAVNRSVDMKYCHINIPIQVPRGYSVSVVQADYRGFLSLPISASAQFDVSYFFPGTRRFTYGQTYRGEQTANYTLSGPPDARVWSPCGQDVQLYTDVRINLSTNARREQALFTLDSADLGAGMIYRLNWKYCEAPVPPPPAPRPAPVPMPPVVRPVPPRPVPAPPRPAPVPRPRPPRGGVQPPLL